MCSNPETSSHMAVRGFHRRTAVDGDWRVGEPCTAPTEAEYIADLEQRLDLLEGTNRKTGGQLLEHSDEVNRCGERIAVLEQQNARLRAAVLNQCGDNLCHLSEGDIAELKLDPARIPPWEQFGESCRRFHAQISCQAGELGPGQMTIAQLEALVVEVEAALCGLCGCLNAAIRVARTSPEMWAQMKVGQQVEHWAEQVKQGMALVAGAPDYCETDDVAKSLREEDEHA